MGKKSSKETSTTTSQPPSWAVPIIQGGSQAIMDNYTKNQPKLDALSAQLTGMIPKLSDTSMLKSGTNYINQTLSGKYLTGNPYLDKMIASTANDVGNRVNSTFSSAGRTGGGANQMMLSEGLANAENALRYQGYSDERQLMGQAAGMLPGYQQAQNSANTTALGGIQLAGQLPYYGSQSLGNIGSLLGSYGTSSTSGTKPGGWGTDILGAAMAAAPFIPGISDRRLKTKIEKIGQASDGLGLYEWNWKAAPDGERIRGVIADEVEKLRPWAFVPNYLGQYAGVNYAALGSLN